MRKRLKDSCHVGAGWRDLLKGSTMRTLFIAAAILLTQSCISAKKDFSTVSFNLRYLLPPDNTAMYY